MSEDRTEEKSSFAFRLKWKSSDQISEGESLFLGINSYNCVQYGSLTNLCYLLDW